MTRIFTRAELYEPVWSKPMIQIAKECEISDVALKKHCARAGIPVPPRGYWAKRQASKRVIPTPPLPPESNSGKDKIVIGLGRTGPNQRNSNASEPRPQSPEEAEFSQLIQTERLAVTKVQVPATLSNPHPIVAKWIEEDRQRQALWRSNGWDQQIRSDRKRPIEKRRLRITSGLCKALELRGYTVRVDVRRPLHLRAKIRNEAVEFHVSEVIRQVRTPLTEAEKKKSFNMNSKWRQERVPTGRLALVIVDSMVGHFPGRWEDKPEKSLEDVLSEALIGFAVAVEILHRASVRRAEEERRYREQEIRRQRLQEEKEAEERRKKGLAQRATEWRQAADIRAYVQAVQNSPESNSKDFDAWALWAMQYADELDPIVSKRAAQLEYRDPDADRDRRYGLNFSGWRA